MIMVNYSLMNIQINMGSNLRVVMFTVAINAS